MFNQSINYMKRKTFLAKALTMLFAVLFSITGARAEETLTVYDGTDQSNTVPAYMFYFDDFTRSQFVIPSDALTPMAGGGTISAITFYTDQTADYTSASTVDVFMKEVDYTTITAFELKDNILYTGKLTVAASGELTIVFATPFVYGGNNLLIGIENTTDIDYKNVKFFGQAVDGASVAGSSSSNLDAVTPSAKNFIPKTTFTYTTGSGVVFEKPTNLTVSDLGTDKVTISWTEPEGKVDAYAYQYKKATEEWSTEETTTTEATVTLTGLESGTPYSFRVKAIYGTDASNWVLVNFTTDCELTALPFSEDFEASIPCWTVVNESSNTPGIVDDGTGNLVFRFSSYNSSTVYDQYLITPEFDGSKAMDVSFMYSRTHGQPELFKVGYSTTTADIDAFTWGDEVSDAEKGVWKEWNDIFPAGTKYVAIHYYSTYQYYLIVDNFTFTESNGIFKPTNFAVSDVMSTSATLSWTENGTSTAWEICVNGDEANLIAATSNPFVLEGLTPETTYTVKVRATDGTNTSKWSNEETFTTDVQFPAPADLAATDVTFDGATLTWNPTADATSYELQYSVAGSAGFTGSWYQYDNGTYATSVGLGGGEFSWAVMFPAGSFSGERVNSVSVFDIAAMTGTISLYSGGDTAPGALVTTKAVTLTGANDFVQVNFGAINIDPSQNLWVVVYNASGESYPAAAATEDVDDPNGRWVEMGGTWYDLGAAGLPGYTWMLRAEIGVMDFSALPWVTVADAVSPCTIAGLTPETDYLVRVKAIYGTEGESDWTSTTFTTPESNPVATDVAVTTTSRTATISWTGISDSYEVAYRSTAVDGPSSYFMDFESGLGDWTNIKNGEGPNETEGWYTYDPTGLSFSAHSGTYCASAWSWANNNAFNADNWLITPKVTFDKQMKYWVRTNKGYPDSYEVLLSTAGNDPADFTVVLQAMAEAPAVADWTKVSIDLSAYEGQEGYIAFHHVSTDCNYLLIDDFSLNGEDTPAGEWVTVTTTEPSVELTGLNPETEYEFTITGIKDGTANAGTPVATFTTGEAFPAPTDLAVNNVKSSSAEISWEADAYATGFELRYAEGGSLVYKYDDGTPVNSLGIDAEFSLAAMFPAGSFTGTTLSNVSLYDLSPASAVVSIYSGGDAEPEGTAIASENVALTGANAPVVVDFGVTIDPTKNVWVVVNFPTGGYYAVANDVLNDANGRWSNLGSGWADLASVGGEGYCWMVGAEIGDFDPATATWTTVDDVTSPAELTGLNAATTYTVEVRAIFGTEGTSEWTSTCFTTGSNNPVPANIAADLAADGATLTWEGEGEGYNVRYRSAAADNYLYEADFSTDLNGWTPYTLGEGPGFAAQAFNGSYSAVAYSYDNDTYTAYSADNWLVSPALELGGTLKFTIKGDSNYPDNYEVLLSTTDAELTSFTTELQSMSATQGDFAIDLSAYAGQTGYIAFHHVSTDCFALAITNLGLVEETPAGAWTEMAVTDATATISGLATDNTYEYQIQSINGGSTSEWSEIGEFSLITLDANGDNDSKLNKFEGKFAHVTLANRVFYKDDTWNTVYLPFDLSEAELANTPLADGDIRTISDLEVEGQTVKINFVDGLGLYSSGGYADFIGGFPYIIKWASGSGNVVNPEFANVTISKGGYYMDAHDSGNTIEIDFGGTYDKIGFDAEDTSILFIGADNKFNYPLAGANILATCGYFYLDGITAGEGSGVKIISNLDDDATGIAGINAKEGGDWYDISGRKLAGKPSLKGIYVNGGRKVTVK